MFPLPPLTQFLSSTSHHDMQMGSAPLDLTVSSSLASTNSPISPGSCSVLSSSALSSSAMSSSALSSSALSSSALSSSALSNSSQNCNGDESASVRRKKTAPIPDHMKDDSYWARRVKNNESARKSRDKARLKEQMKSETIKQLTQTIVELETENKLLRGEIAELHKFIKLQFQVN